MKKIALAAAGIALVAGSITVAPAASAGSRDCPANIVNVIGANTTLFPFEPWICGGFDAAGVKMSCRADFPARIWNCVPV